MSYHTLIIGSPGTGKSTLLTQLALDYIHQNEGVFFIDPIGHHIDQLIQHIPFRRITDTVLFDPSLADPAPVNILANSTPATRPIIASAVLSAFRDLAKYGDASTGVFDRLILNAIYAILETPKPSLISIKDILLSDTYRSHVLNHVSDPFIKRFWVEEYQEWPDRMRIDRVQSTLNQVDMIVNDERLRAHFCYNTTTPIQDRTIFLARLPVAKLGIQKTRIAGLLLMAYHQLSAPVPILIDVAHHFQEHLMYALLSGTVPTTVVFNALTEMERPIASAAMSAHNKIAFRIADQDAERFDKLLRLGDQEASTYQLKNFEYYLSHAGAYKPTREAVPAQRHRKYRGVPLRLRQHMNRHHRIHRRTVLKAINAR